MKKYSSGSFIDAAVRVYGSEADTLTSFPASIIANGGNITPWTVYGNTVESVSVGDKTKNLFNVTMERGTITDRGNPDTSTGRIRTADFIELEEGTYTLNATANTNLDTFVFVYNLAGTFIERIPLTWASIPYTFTIENKSKIKFLLAFSPAASGAAIVVSDVNNIMLNTGDSALPYEPYGYNVAITCNSVAYNCYISDVLRKSTGADPVYDIMSSTGTITRNVDTDGTPLLTPTTESFTAPTLATVAGSQSVSFDTTIKPSKAELTYTGWHTHSDKKRSGGAWT